MSLTRNLYREDELLAALRLSLVRGKAAEALFWVQEGLDSDMDVRIFQTLLSVWLLCVGVQNVPWLGWLVESLRDSIDEEKIAALTVGLALSKKDSSVFALLALGLEQSPEAPDHVGRFDLPAGLCANGPVETVFAKALLQGKSEFAWSLSMPLWADGRADEILWEIQPLAVFNQIEAALEPIWTPEFLMPFRALGILMATSKRSFVGTPIPSCPKEHMDAWNDRKELPMRKRRAYAVPSECLYWLTERGSMRTSESSEGDIMGSLRHICSTSSFWSDKLDYRLHDTYFTSDIPDEWSCADREKSHGRGPVPAVPNPDRTILFERALSRLYGAVPSRLIWRGSERAVELLVRRWSSAKPASFEQGVHEIYEGLETFVEKWDLTPVRIEVTA